MTFCLLACFLETATPMAQFSNPPPCFVSTVDFSLYPGGQSARFWSVQFCTFLVALPFEVRWDVLNSLSFYLTVEHVVPASMLYIWHLTQNLVEIFRVEIESVSLEKVIASLLVHEEMYEYVRMADALITHDLRSESFESKVQILPADFLRKRKPICVIRVIKGQIKPVKRKGFVLGKFELPVWTKQSVPVVEKSRRPKKPRSFYHLRRLERGIKRRVRGIVSTIFKKVISENRKDYVKQTPPKPIRRIERQKYVDISLQSGRVVSPSRRMVREALQRSAAKERKEELRKSIPKRERERLVKEFRDKRNGVFEDVELQSSVWKVGAGVLGIGLTLGAKTLSLFNKGSGALDAFKELIDMIKNAARKLKKSMKSVLWKIPLVLAVFYLCREYVTKLKPLVAVLTGVLATLVGQHVWEVISKFFPDRDTDLQAGKFDCAPKLLSTLFTFSVFGKKLSPSTVTEFCKRISLLDKAASGWETFFEWVSQAVESLINFARARFGKERVSLFKNVHGPAYRWAEQVDKLCANEAVAGEITTDTLDEMVKLVTTGYGFKETYRGTSMARYIDAYVIKITNVLQPYLGALNARNNYRFEPAACMLLGAPGIGKTLMAMPFCASIMLMSGLLPKGSSFEDVAKNVWQKGTSEYWNSYANQICLVMDDAFQSKADATNAENEYMSLIRMVGTWSFPLNFADLASKGKVFFGSKFIFGTTNLPSINSEARIVLHEPEAVTRRINFPYELRVRPDYTDGVRLNYSAFERELKRCQVEGTGLAAFPWYIWEVRKHDYIRGQPMSDWGSIQDLIQEIAVDLRSRAESHTVTKDFMSSYVKGFDDRPFYEKAEGGDIESQAMRVLNRRLPQEPIVRPHVDPQFAARPHANDADLDHFRRELAALQAENNYANRFLKSFAIGYMVTMGITVTLQVLIMTVRALHAKFTGGKPNAGPRVQSNRPLTRTRKVLATDLRLQSGDTSVANNVYSNTYKMFLVTNGGAELVVGQICFLENDLAIQPEHFSRVVEEHLADCIEPQNKIHFRNAANKEHVFTCTVEYYLALPRVTYPDKDIEFLRFRDVRAHRNIVNNFMREADLKHIPGYRGRLDVCEVDDRKQLLPVNKRMVYTFPSLKYGEKLAFGGRKLERYFSYSAATSCGDCGAPLCIFDNSSFSGRTVIGFHVSGSVYRGVGYSNVVTQEEIVNARESMGVIRDEFMSDLQERVDVSVQSGVELPFVKKGSFMPICMVAKPVVICPKTSYYPTKLYGAIGEYTQLPAPLSPVFRGGELVYPMENAVAPYSTPLLIYEQPWLKQALHVAMTPLTGLTRNYPRRIYTFEESVCGIPQEKFRSVPRGTAAGFPYIYDVRNGKKEFFGESEVYDLNTDRALELKARVEYIESKAKEGIRLAHVFVDFLKDELRTAAKVEAVATRLISSAPLDYTIIWRKYFGAFSSAVMRVHTHSGMAPGICAYSDWDVLVERLSLKGQRVFDGDFKAFDSSEQPTIHRLILDFINKWYDDGEDNARVRSVLWLDLMHSRHIGGDGKDQRYIYQWNKSLPSGHPFTTIVNSMYSLCMLVAAYISCTSDLTGFWDNVSAVTYGDDNASNVSESVSDRFNQQTVAVALEKEFNLKYTPGNKTGEYEPYTQLSRITFLKRGFLCESNFWTCPLELESFLYTFYWCKNKKLERTICIDVLETALEELSLHSPTTWDEYSPLLKSIFDDLEVVTRCPCEQSQYLALVRSRTDAWY
jgi:hypothetical protein